MKAVRRQFTSRTAALVVFENALILGAVALSAWIRLGQAGWPRFAEESGLAKAFLIACVCQACLYYADLYNFRLGRDSRDLFIRLVQGLGATSFVLAVLYFWFPQLIIGRGVFLIASGLVISLVAGWRLVFRWLSGRMRPRERLLLVGTSASAIALARELFDRREDLGVDLVGFIDPDPSRVGTVVINPGVMGVVDDIPVIVRGKQVSRVVVSLSDARGKLPMEKLLEMKLDGVRFDHLASVYEEFTGKIAVENLRPSWLIFSSGFRKSTWLMAAKRALDVTAAALGLVIGLPIMGIIAAVLKASSRGPVLYHQKRVGKDGRVFTVHKFRSMVADAEASTGAVWAHPNDTRVTSVGRFLRRTRLDELPQLWNILIGDMSVVGPRPERPEFVEKLVKQIPFYGERHTLKPGLTGWAQVQYTYGATVEDALEKLQYDLYYIKNMSLALDLFIIFTTIKTVILQRGA